MAEKINTSSNVVAIPKRSGSAAKRESERKWGVDVIGLGFCIVPSLLFRAQERLGLSATQLAFLVQLADFWWRENEIPWPKKATLGQRLGLSAKQIQRIARELEDGGFIKRVKRMTQHGQRSNGYDLRGLVSKIKKLAPEFAEAAEAKRKVERRGGLKKTSA